MELDTVTLWSTRLGGWLLELALIFLLLFWMVGAYNRLMRLRQAVGAAWLQIDDLLTRRAVALDALLGAVQEPLTAESGSLQALRQAHESQRQAALAVRVRPSRTALLKGWVEAELALASPLARLNALVELHPELGSVEAVQANRKTLAELAQRLGYARQLFNDAAEAHNTAIGEFPTRLLTRLFGFRHIQRV